jgi:deoxycytidine triphosphate deaminase
MLVTSSRALGPATSNVPVGRSVRVRPASDGATTLSSSANRSTLTLELKNLLRYSALRLTPGMYIGQMIFYRVVEVPAERSYATIGRYNKDVSVQIVKE